MCSFEKNASIVSTRTVQELFLNFKLAHFNNPTF